MKLSTVRALSTAYGLVSSVREASCLLAWVARHCCTGLINLFLWVLLHCACWSAMPGVATLNWWSGLEQASPLSWISKEDFHALKRVGWSSWTAWFTELVCLLCIGLASPELARLLSQIIEKEFLALKRAVKNRWVHWVLLGKQGGNIWLSGTQEFIPVKGTK